MAKKKVKIYKTKKKTPESKIIEELQSRYDKIDERSISKFADLPLSQKTLKGLKENNYIELTDIQKQSIGLALRGCDILGAAKTGSGKTLAFLVPVLEILYCKQWTRLDGVGAIIISPTRELAYQIYETLRKVGHHHEISAGLIIGGKDLNFEKKRMDQCNVIICTPGRLLQHMDENPLFDCVNMQILVLDEADRCLDMGFEQTMNSIIENLPPKRQTLLFSATQTKSVKDLARLSLTDPMYVSVHEYAEHTTPDGLQQSYIVCPLEDKLSMLWSFIRNHLKHKIIVFFASCKQVKYVFEAFCRLRPGVSLLALYGTLHQLRRMDIYENFCKKQHAVLFATDIAARGLDFPAVNWVVQMDCPEDVNAYIHRAGRTARFQKGGESLLVLLPSEVEMVNRLQEHKIPINMIKINPAKLHSPQRKLEALLARDVALKETAQRAFVAYVKSVFLMKDKKIFDVHALDTDPYAKSLGLAIPPRIRFLKRIQKNMTNIKKENIKLAENEVNKSDNDLDTSSEDEEKVSTSKNKEVSFTNDNFNALDGSDEDDILTIKRKNINVDDFSGDEIQDKIENETESTNKKKPVTKAAVAKKIIRKKIVANKKTVFDEEGQEILDPTKAKVSEVGKNYENEVESGINIEVAKQILREEDRFDKQRFREKVKQKHREEKQKLKKAKKKDETEKMSDDEKLQISDNAFSENENESESESESECKSDAPDLSWLPDPDKVYNTEDTNKEKSDNTSDNTSENNSEDQPEDSSEDDAIHRPRKRKLMTQEEYKKRRKEQRTSDVFDRDLKIDEELALQLLRN